MCGRFTQSQSASTIAATFHVATVPGLLPRYNIAPTQPVPAILVSEEPAERELRQLRWGLIPSWAKDSSMAARMINARAETVA
ncbi:MAG TPA: SOS response-associated peptidase family protein, partial [Candidatus Obscuribacterales bacterium]